MSDNKVKVIATADSDSVEIVTEVPKDLKSVPKDELKKILSGMISGLLVFANREGVLEDIIEEFAKEAEVDVKDLFNAVLTARSKQKFDYSERMFG